MIPVTPHQPHDSAAVLVVYAADQPEYHSLPAYRTPDGLILAEFELDAAELDRVCRGGRVRLWVHTFNRPLQPVAVEIAEPVDPA